MAHCQAHPLGVCSAHKGQEGDMLHTHRLLVRLKARVFIIHAPACVARSLKHRLIHPNGVRAAWFGVVYESKHQEPGIQLPADSVVKVPPHVVAQGVLWELEEPARLRQRAAGVVERIPPVDAR